MLAERDAGFGGSVAGGEAKQHAPAGQIVDGWRRLGDMDRVTQGDDGGTRAKGHAAYPGRQKRQIGERIEHLPHVAEARVVGGNISRPECGETEFIGPLGKFAMCLHGGRSTVR